MALAHSRVSVGTTATTLGSARDGDPTGVNILIQNPDASVTVYIGGAGVTTSSYGFALLAGQVLSLPLHRGEVVYGVVATSTLTVNVLTEGV